MSWRELTPLATKVVSHIRNLPDACLVAAPVADHGDALFPEERAGVALARHMRGLGIDLEAHGRVGGKLYSKLFTDSELAAPHRTDPRQAGLLFSAKESGSRAVHPLVGPLVPLQAAEVEVD